MTDDLPIVTFVAPPRLLDYICGSCEGAYANPVARLIEQDQGAFWCEVFRDVWPDWLNDDEYAEGLIGFTHTDGIISLSVTPRSHVWDANGNPLAKVDR